ncbi:hypothetical protein KKD03_01530 [Patescibacteria group bacterium]|nr:hypothetical protein [Patescibacteria group bacterium]
MAVENLILIIISVLMAGLSFYVLFRNFRSSINISFFVMGIGVVIWVATNGVFMENQDLFMGKLTFTGAMLILVGFFYFSVLFPFRDKKIDWLMHALLLIPFILLNIFLYSGDLFIGEVVSRDTLSFGVLYHVFAIYFLIFWIWIILNFVRKYRASDGLHKWQLKNLFYAISFSSIAGIITNLLMPWILNVQYGGWIGPMFSIFFLGFVSYILFKKDI